MRPNPDPGLFEGISRRISTAPNDTVGQSRPHLYIFFSKKLYMMRHRLLELPVELLGDIVALLGASSLPTLLATTRRWTPLQPVLWSALRDVILSPDALPAQAEPLPLRWLSRLALTQHPVPWLDLCQLRRVRVLCLPPNQVITLERGQRWLPPLLEELHAGRVRSFEHLECPALKVLQATPTFSSTALRDHFLNRRALPGLEALMVGTNCEPGECSFLPADWPTGLVRWFPALRFLRIDSYKHFHWMEAPGAATRGQQRGLWGLVIDRPVGMAPLALLDVLQKLKFELPTGSDFDLAALPRTLTELNLSANRGAIHHLEQLPPRCHRLALWVDGPSPLSECAQPLHQVQHLVLSGADRFVGGDVARWKRWFPAVFPDLATLAVHLIDPVGDSARDWYGVCAQLPRLQCVHWNWPDADLPVDLGLLNHARHVEFQQAVLPVGELGSICSWALWGGHLAEPSGSPADQLCRIAASVQRLRVACHEGFWLATLASLAASRADEQGCLFPALRELRVCGGDSARRSWRSWFAEHRHHMPLVRRVEVVASNWPSWWPC